MVLSYWWLALALLLLVLGISVWRFATSLTRRRDVSGAPRLAHTSRIRALPRFQFLARQRVRWLTVDLLFVSLSVIGALLLVARPMSVGEDSREVKSRDVMLCLDVSGSMTNADQVLIKSYRKLVDRLDGERIGLVVWNGSGALAFPLTDDYVFVDQQLGSMLAALGGQSDQAEASDGRAVIDAANIGNGSSLIGDGAMSCLQRFDQPARDRPRTVVLATDNQLAGDPIFSLAEAGRRARDERVLIFGISPNIDEGAEKDELRHVVESTGGTLMDITTDPAIEDRIANAIEKQQRKAILGTPSARSFDLIWPGALITTIGLMGMMLVGMRGRT